MMNSKRQFQENSKKSDYWQKSVISQSSNIRDAIQTLNDVQLRILLVCETDGKLIGTVSDGDIRRGLLNGLDLSSAIESIICKNPITASENHSRNQILHMMSKHNIYQIPILDESGRLIGLYLWDSASYSLKRPNKMIIMAGGKGRRLLPKTEKTPKPMLQILGKPILEHIIDQAKLDGFNDFIISVNHLAPVIKDYFQDGSDFNVKIEYISEDLPLGTGGSLSLIDPMPTESIIVTNGDVLTKFRYGKILDHHEDNNAFATMAVHTHEWQNPFGVVEVDGFDIKEYSEKPIVRALVNAGVYVLNPKALELLEKGVHCDMPTLFEIARKLKHKVIAYPIHENWLDIGRPEDLQIADSRFSEE